MSILRNTFIIFFLFSISINPIAYQQVDRGLLSKDQEEILNLYASEYLLEEYQHLFHKSISQKKLLTILTLPLTAEDFKLPEIALHPDTKIQKGDTLFSEGELNDWSKQISKYQQIEWSPGIYSDSVRFIQENEIPDYLNRTDIPPPGQDPVFIHYITPPFIYDGQTALMYAKRWSSGANIKSTCYYFLKIDGRWQLKATVRIGIGY